MSIPRRVALGLFAAVAALHDASGTIVWGDFWCLVWMNGGFWDALRCECASGARVTCLVIRILN